VSGVQDRRSGRGPRGRHPEPVTDPKGRELLDFVLIVLMGLHDRSLTPRALNGRVLLIV
jgi:hypothetical protein